MLSRIVALLAAHRRSEAAGTSIAFGLKVPPLMGDKVVQIQALVLDVNMKPVANFAISVRVRNGMGRLDRLEASAKQSAC